MKHKKPIWWYSGFEKNFFYGIKHYLRCWNNTMANPFKYLYYAIKLKWRRYQSKRYYQHRNKTIKKVEMNLTGNETIKALKHCKISNCIGCPYHDYDVPCLDVLAPNALDLINSLKTKNKKLHKVINSFEKQSHEELLLICELSEKYEMEDHPTEKGGDD